MDPVDSIINRKGGQQLSDFIMIDEREWGYSMTTQCEIRFESYQQLYLARLRFTTFKTSGTQGKEKHSFDWPVKNPESMAEVHQIFQTILDMNQPDAEVHDPRGLLSRFFNNLFNVQLINSRENLAEHDAFDKRTTLSAQIHRERHGGLVVTLKHHVERGRQMWIRFPLETAKAIAKWTAD